ncbi:MAG: pyridoxamine 5'-phosphate oxidase family protein [Reyranella sp.]|uniref:pyridoxamine 5'-phosphate oxidase family protein n=1 Tax=Reyranella sp. TaxID=1929291 RepID=UPI00273007FD|nr:pyridoxamine 5'-phosphate oxidase family protein [Reyranella sp.]MDP1961791.1 pyridoxamine 5'-phosphate oxidase family protein [Reyranella sp.]MDP2374773.1 pyridoxamine 5'-phosphate oxidase family protein [Reyranella sp.]
MSPQDGSSEFLAFHGDELAAQALGGAGPTSARMRPFMPDQHRDFFAGLPYLFVAAADAEGWPVASVLSGEPGFVHSPDPVTLRINSAPDAGDPATAGLATGRDVGLLGLDLTNRRRNRANGQLTEVDEDGLTVRVTQSFGNCAQYIQTRRPTAAMRTPAPVERFDGLDDAARALVTASDTFFVASRSRLEVGSDGGLDMSHRGGRPGFVGMQGDTHTLVIPDFRGNRFFNTLGNLLGDPRAGLLFIDFASGDLLQLKGRVEIDWAPGGAGPEGTERLWRVRVERGWRRRGAFPFAWTFGGYAPTTLRTGVW